MTKTKTKTKTKTMTPKECAEELLAEMAKGDPSTLRERFTEIIRRTITAEEGEFFRAWVAGKVRWVRCVEVLGDGLLKVEERVPDDIRPHQFGVITLNKVHPKDRLRLQSLLQSTQAGIEWDGAGSMPGGD